MNKIQYTTKEGLSIVVPVYNGKTIDKMPELIAQDYTPISIAEIMEQRLIAWQSENSELANLWGRNYFDSGDSVIYHPDGRIKIVPDSQTLRSVNNNTQLNWNGAQVLSSGSFDKAEGEEFTRKDLEKYAGKYLRENEVLDNPIWLALVRGNKDLLKEYTQAIYSKIDDPELMRIWVSEKKPEFEAERLWSFIGLVSDVGGDVGGRLNYDEGLLVGVPNNVSLLDATKINSTAPKGGHATSKIVHFGMRINLEALMNDFHALREGGDLSPKIEEVLKKYKI